MIPALFNNISIFSYFDYTCLAHSTTESRSERSSFTNSTFTLGNDFYKKYILV